MPNVGARALEKLYKTYIFRKKWTGFSWLKEERNPPSMDCSQKTKIFKLTSKYLYESIHTILCPKLLHLPLFDWNFDNHSHLCAQAIKKKKAPFLFWNAPSIASRFKNEKSTGILQLLFQMIPRLMSFNKLGN